MVIGILVPMISLPMLLVKNKFSEKIRHPIEAAQVYAAAGSSLEDLS